MTASSMTEIACDRHGTFSYRGNTCPGCTHDAEQRRRAFVKEAEVVWAELAAAYRNNVEQEREMREAAAARVRDAKARHERNAPERPTGFAARFKEAAYEEQLQAFLRETGRFDVEIREAEKQLTTFENRVRQTNVTQHLMSVMENQNADLFAALLDDAHLQKAEKERRARDAAQVDLDLAELEQRQGERHAIGSPGSKYRDYWLRGVAIINGKRYARLASSYGFERDVTCVPWIDVLAGYIGQQVTIEWVKDSTYFRVSDRDLADEFGGINAQRSRLEPLAGDDHDHGEIDLSVP